MGIQFKMDIAEQTVFITVSGKRQYDEMMAASPVAGMQYVYNGACLRGAMRNNASYVDDPLVNKTLDAMSTVFFTDPAAAERLLRGIMPYILEQVWYIPTPSAPQYTFWWPWVKNFYGTALPKYLWIDLELKKSMGYMGY